MGRGSEEARSRDRRMDTAGVRPAVDLDSSLLTRERQENHLNLGGGGCGELQHRIAVSEKGTKLYFDIHDVRLLVFPVPLMP